MAKIEVEVCDFCGSTDGLGDTLLYYKEEKVEPYVGKDKDGESPNALWTDRIPTKKRVCGQCRAHLRSFLCRDIKENVVVRVDTMSEQALLKKKQHAMHRASPPDKK